MPEIKSADQATQVAVDFLKKHYPWPRPLRAKNVEGKWIVEVDVGAFYPREAKVTIDPVEGVILDYQVAEASPPQLPGRQG